MTVDGAEGELSAFVAKYPFAVDPKVFRQLDAEPTGQTGEANPGCHDYAAEQETAMLADLVRRMGPILERRAAEVRTRPPLLLGGVAADWVADAIVDFH